MRYLVDTNVFIDAFLNPPRHPARQGSASPSEQRSALLGQLFGRAVLHLDTTFYYAAAGFHVPPFQFFFAPYYSLGVLALFTHVGCALYWQVQSSSRTARVLAVAVPSVVGLVVSLLIVLTLAGVFYPVQVPPEYKATYGWHP